MNEFEITKAEGELYTEGPALIPDVIDSQGDIVDAGEVRRASYNWMAAGHRPGLMHKFELGDEAVTLVENRLLRQAETIAGKQLPVGTWVVKFRINDSRLKHMVLQGRLRAFSIGGRSQTED